MQVKEAANKIEAEGNIPPEVIVMGAEFLLKVALDLLSRKGRKEKRIAALENICHILVTQFGEITLRVEKLESKLN